MLPAIDAELTDGDAGCVLSELSLLLVFDDDEPNDLMRLKKRPTLLPDDDLPIDAVLSVELLFLVVVGVLEDAGVAAEELSLNDFFLAFIAPAFHEIKVVG